jgi:hypothetical protein|tara:strand:+ start:334 stop:543 length:210 start_codon:yes stop_codon:yes gene_type:complete
MPQSLEDLVEQFREEGLSEEEAIKAAKKRFLKETKRKTNTKVRKAKFGGVVKTNNMGDSLVASFYKGDK